MNEDRTLSVLSKALDNASGFSLLSLLLDRMCSLRGTQTKGGREIQHPRPRAAPRDWRRRRRTTTTTRKRRRRRRMRTRTRPGAAVD